MTDRLQAAYQLIGIAQNWGAKGEPARAMRTYEQALNSFMFLSITDSSDAGAVSAWLGNHPFESACSRYFELASALLKDGPSHSVAAFQDDLYTRFAHGHFFAAIGQHGRATFLMNNAFEGRGRSTPFWSEYRDAMRAMLSRETYTPVFQRLKGLETHWKHYVDLTCIVVSGSDRTAILSVIDESFAARNRDMRLNGIGVLDGSGTFAVAFDIRKAGLLATIEHEGL